MLICYKGKQIDLEVFERKGPGDTILYLHGLGTSKEDFLPAKEVQKLNEYRLVMFDFPGCGKTKTKQNIHFTIDDLVNITDEVVNKLGLKRFHLVGHSMGGLTGLFYACKFPHKVRSFINVEGNLDPIDCRIFSRFVCDYPPTASEENFFMAFSNHVRVGKNLELDVFLSKVREKVSFSSLREYCGSIVHHCESAPLLNFFIDVPCPKMFIYGQENNDLTYLNKLSTSGVDIQEIPGSNHFPFYSNPSHFFNTISKFVRAIK